MGSFLCDGLPVYCRAGEIRPWKDGSSWTRVKTVDKASRKRVLRSFQCITAIAVACAFDAQASEAQDRGQARSMVISKSGIVASESPLASQAGVRILESGGNAVDAAIATNAMMGVVEPMMNGIGGDLFAIVYDAKANKLYGLNASGWAPKGLTIEFLQRQALKDMPQKGINSVTVPGAVEGWQKLAEKFGRKKLSEDLAAAIATAHNGFPVPEMTAAYWAGEVDALRSNEAAAKLYLPDDRAPKTGEIFRNEELAWSLQQISAHGREAFYKGDIAIRILAVEKKHGGTMTADDLSQFAAEWVEHHVSRLDGLRTAAERTGFGGAGNAQHSRDNSPWSERLRIRDGESSALDD
jgi:gamma-glutamyltranspeptidase/glutathione hydrolase